MSIALALLVQVAGVAVVLVGLHDVFNTVFHPTRTGTISDFISHAVWKFFRVGESSTGLVVAGPAATVTVIAYWVTSLVLGCALIDWMHLKTGFTFAPGLDPAAHHRFVDALNFSFSSAITVTPVLTPVRAGLTLLANLEAMAAFAVLTASISWLLAIYPVLEHRRNFAHRVAVLRKTGEEVSADPFREEPAAMANLLRDFTVDLIRLRTELGQFPITFYFYEDDPRSSVANALEHLSNFAKRASEASCPPRVRFEAQALDTALHDLLRYIDARFLHEKPPTRR